jgi:predicted KAP-like P-loop ATPase
MIHKNKFEINEDDIFSNDKLKRKIEIENLSSLIASTSEAFTMSINADWGAGKTTFIKLWKEYLHQVYGINSIYFSAWEDDFSKEPLLSILGEINNYIDENYDSEDEVTKKFDKVKNFGAKVLKRGLPALVKGVTTGILDVDKGFESAIGAITEEATKESIENYSKEKEVTKQFQDSILSLLTQIDDDNPFVIFIDELDRCRPLYAIELLERVKHIFGIDGLVFVLSIDKKQLSESIKSQYGNIDTSAYLKRFIDLEYNLANINKDNFCDYLYNKYEIDKIITSKDIKNTFSRDLDHLAMMKYLVESLDLTLREIEQAFLQIVIVFKTIQPRLFDSHFRVFIFFIVLKIKDQELYFDLIYKKIPYEDIKNKIITKKTNDSHYDLSTMIKSIIYAISVTDEELQNIIQEEQKKLEAITDTYSNEYKKQEWLISLLRHGYGQWNTYSLNKLVDTVMKKINFLDRFDLE